MSKNTGLFDKFAEQLTHGTSDDRFRLWVFETNKSGWTSNPYNFFKIH